MNYGFIFIEGSVQQNRNSSTQFKGSQQLPIERIGSLIDGLNPSRPIHVRHRGHDVPFLREDRIDLHHERIRNSIADIFTEALFQYRSSEWSAFFAELNLRVDNFPHVCTSGLCQNATITKSPGSPFHTALEPSDDLALSNSVCCPAASSISFGNVLNLARQSREFLLPCVQGSVALFIRKFGPQISVVHDETPRLTQELMPNISRRT